MIEEQEIEDYREENFNCDENEIYENSPNEQLKTDNVMYINVQKSLVN